MFPSLGTSFFSFTPMRHGNLLLFQLVPPSSLCFRSEQPKIAPKSAPKFIKKEWRNGEVIKLSLRRLGVFPSYLASAESFAEQAISTETVVQSTILKQSMWDHVNLFLSLPTLFAHF